MLNRILAVTIVILVLFSAGCSEISGLRGVLDRPSLVANPEITTTILSALTGSSQGVVESDQTNNVLTFQVATSAADLIVQSITWSPANPSKDDIVTFNVAIKNQGSDRALSTRVYFYTDGFFKSSQDIPSLDAGGLVTKTFTWIAEVGSHVIKAIADAENWIPESDKSNNERAVTILTVPPDLIIPAITWSPASPVEGDNVTFTVTIKNQGNGRAEYSSVAFYVDDNLLTFTAVGPVVPSATDNRTFSWIAQVGSHTIKAVADQYNQVVESDESNNEKTVTFPTLAADLIVQSITWSPASLIAGEIVTFSVTIKNQGNARASSTRVDFYVDGFFKSFQDISTIGVGGSVTKTFTWAAEPGSHVITAIADPYNQIAESSENNNERAVTFSGAPPADLIIQGITWSSASSLVGEKVTFTVSIKNQGKGIAADSYVAYYIDDVYLTVAQVGPISPGATDNKTFTWTVEAGSHFIKAIADSTRLVTEGNEGNNEKVVIYPVSADLIIQAITWSPVKPSGSDNMTFVVIVKNQGSEEADSFYVAYYIDGAYLGFVPVGPIGSGATDNSTFIWTAQAGSHAVKAVIDPYSKIIESNENNNEKTVTFLVSRPAAPVPSSAPSPVLAPVPTPPTKPPESPAVNPEPVSSAENESRLGLLFFVAPVVLLIGVFIVFLRSRQR